MICLYYQQGRFVQCVDILEGTLVLLMQMTLTTLTRVRYVVWVSGPPQLLVRLC
jgi:hypothetical protein